MIKVFVMKMMREQLFPKLCLFIIIILIPSITISEGLFVKVVSADPKPLVISGNEIYSIVNCSRDFDQEIYVEENGTLYIENSNITIKTGYKIYLQNPANGFPKLIVKNSIITSERRRAKVILLMDNSSIYSVYSKFDKCSIEAEDDAHLELIASSLKSSYIYLREESSVSASSQSDLGYFYLYDNAFLKIDNSNVKKITIYDNGSANVTKTSFFEASGGVELHDNGSAYFGSGCSFEAGQIKLYDNGRVRIYNSSIFSYFTSFAVNLVAKGNSSVELVDTNIFVFRAEMKENSTLSANSVQAKGSVLLFRDYSYGMFNESEIDWLMSLYDNCSVEIWDSNIKCFDCAMNSTVKVFSSEVSMINIHDNARILLSDSSIGEFNLPLSGIVPKLVLCGGFVDSFVLKYGGVDIELVNCDVEGWDLKVSKGSNVHIYDSVLDSVSVIGGSTLYVTNSTLETVYTDSSSAVEVYSYIEVRVVDYLGNPLSGASVEVRCPNGTISNFLSGDDGRVVFKVFVSRIVGVNEFGAGCYNITAYYGDISSGTLSVVPINTLKRVTLTVPIPWWYWPSIISIVVLVVGSASVAVYLKFLKKKRT